MLFYVGLNYHHHHHHQQYHHQQQQPKTQSIIAIEDRHYDPFSYILMNHDHYRHHPHPYRHRHPPLFIHYSIIIFTS